MKKLKDTKCIKCGYHEKTIKYREGIRADGQLDKLLYTCNRCLYTWKEDCLDKK